MTAASLDSALAGFAAEVGTAGPVAVEGRRTRWDLGGVLDDGTHLVRAPSGIVEYRPEEMTVRVRAGTTVDELDAALAERGQRTALPDRGGTVGGALAVGENDICRLGRGSVRDAALQVRYASAEGEIVSGGGAVVKNVSGFNLPKLMVGSLGTLGLLAEVVLRTNPVPDTSRWVACEGPEPTAILDALLAPSAALWDRERTWVLLEGHRDDVATEQQILEGIATVAEVAGAPILPPYRWSLTPARAATAAFLDTGRMVASVGVGTAWCEHPQPARQPDAGSRLVARRAKALFDPTGRLNPGRDAGF
jgi:FAD/FMN-containing dehydrogenase